MKPIDLSKVAVGDVVLVRARVTRVFVNDLVVEFPGVTGPLLLARPEIAGHEPPALRAGDRVRRTDVLPELAANLRVVAIDEDQVWLRHESGWAPDFVFYLDKLERIP